MRAVLLGAFLLIAPSVRAEGCLEIRDASRVLVADLGAILDARPAPELDGFFASADCRFSREPGPDILDPTAILYVNGVDTPPARFCETLRAIEEATGRPVAGVYNATEGRVADYVETNHHRMTVYGRTAKRLYGMPGGVRAPDTASDAVERWILGRRANGRPVEIWAHSQGGAITAKALYDASDDLAIVGVPLDGEVHVRSFGSAAPAWPDGPAYEHWIDRRDPVARYFGLGSVLSQGWRTGKGARVRRFGWLGSSSVARHDMLAYVRRWSASQ